MSSNLPFTPEELLEFWQLTWFPLSETQQQKFLGTKEAYDLCKWQRSDVMRFLTIEKKLQIVLRELRVEAQRIAEFERIRNLKESSVAGANLKSGKIWCSDCSCDHHPGQHISPIFWTL